MAEVAERRRIVVFGTGAMATLFGARLARSGHSVALCGSWKEGLEAVRRSGARVEGSRQPWIVDLDAVDLGEEARSGRRSRLIGGEAASLALILVKSHQSGAIARHLGRLLAPTGTAVTLQNGLGNRELLESEARRQVALGVTTAAARMIGPGRVWEVSTGRTVLPAAQEEMARLLGAAGFDVATSRDIRPHVWLKLAINCAINPVTALEGIPNGGLLERSAARRLAVAAAAEVAAVAAARGVVLPASPVEEALRVAQRTAANRSSMLEDVRRGAPTEIDAMCGAVIARGRQVEVPTPVNERLFERVRRLEGREPAAVAVEMGA